MKIRRIVISVIAVILILIAGATAAFMIIASRYEKGMKELTINAVDASRLADGVYTGSFYLLPNTSKVRVTIAGGRISSIDLLSHLHGKGHSGEKIIDRIIDKQSLQVDVISGATGSSKVILKAVGKAFISGKSIAAN